MFVTVVVTEVLLQRPLPLRIKTIWEVIRKGRSVGLVICLIGLTSAVVLSPIRIDMIRSGVTTAVILLRHRVKSMSFFVLIISSRNFASKT